MTIRLNYELRHRQFNNAIINKNSFICAINLMSKNIGSAAIHHIKRNNLLLMVGEIKVIHKFSV